MQNTSLRFVIASILGCGAVTATVPAHAQASTATLEEIVVTAQRRESNLQDVPVAVSAFSSEALAAAGVTRIENLANAVPNVFINTGTSIRATIISVRGISSNPNNPGVDPAVGVFVDGVYMGRPTTINSGLYDLERIEFLRGPQGTLYGKNTIAGAINFITRMPADELSGEVHVGYGNYDNVTAYAAVSGPLGDERLTARLSGNYQDRGGYLDNLYTRTELDDADEVGGRLALAFAATDDLKVVLHADMSRNRTHAGGQDVLDNGAFTGAPFADVSPFDRKVAYDRDNVGDRDQSGVSLHVDWDTAIGRLASITAYREFEWTNMGDNDLTVLNMLSTGISEDQQQFSQEFRLVSESGGPFEYVAGLYYEDQALDTVSRAIVGPDLGVYPDEVIADIFADVESSGWAAYAQGTYKFTDQWSLSAGLRYSDEEKDVRHSQTGDPFQVLLPTYPVSKHSRSDSETSPSASLNWRPNESVLAYLSYAHGFKAGGFNVFSMSPTNDAAYEPGAGRQLRDRRQDDAARRAGATQCRGLHARLRGPAGEPAGAGRRPAAVPDLECRDCREQGRGSGIPDAGDRLVAVERLLRLHRRQLRFVQERDGAGRRLFRQRVAAGGRQHRECLAAVRPRRRRRPRAAGAHRGQLA